VKKNYKEMETRYALAGEALTVKVAWTEVLGQLRNGGSEFFAAAAGFGLIWSTLFYQSWHNIHALIAGSKIAELPFLFFLPNALAPDWVNGLLFPALVLPYLLARKDLK